MVYRVLLISFTFSCFSADVPPPSRRYNANDVIHVHGRPCSVVEDTLQHAHAQQYVRLLIARENRHYIGQYPLSYCTHTMQQWYRQLPDGTIHYIEDPRIFTSDTSLTSLGLGIMLSCISAAVYLWCELYDAVMEDNQVKTSDSKESNALS